MIYNIRHTSFFSTVSGHFRKFVCIFFAAVTLISVSGCSGDRMRSIIECVPENAVVVRTVDLAYLFREAGVPSPVRSDTLSEDAAGILSLFVPADFHVILTRLLAAPGAVDLSGMLMFTDAAGRDIAILPVSDPRILDSVIEGERGVEAIGETDGLKFRIIDNMTLATDGMGLCFIAGDIMTVASALADARISHFGVFGGVHDFLTEKSACNIAVNCGNSPLSFMGGGSRWLCMSLNATRQSVTLTGKLMNREGALDSIGGNFKEIDTDFLRYTPSDASVILAFGQFSGNARALGMLLGRFAPIYLEQADGTTSLYALPASGNPEAVAAHEAGSWNVETMVHVPENLLEVGLAQYAARAGGLLNRINNNQWEYSSDGNDYYFGTFDGSLVFSSNREIASDFNNGFTEDFQGKRVAMVVDVPYRSVLARAWGLPYGVTFKIGLNAMDFKMRVTFNGAEATALRSLLKLPQLPDLQARFSNTLGL